MDIIAKMTMYSCSRVLDFKDVITLLLIFVAIIIIAKETKANKSISNPEMKKSLHQKNVRMILVLALIIVIFRSFAPDMYKCL
ncbi:hypothetical protein IPO96_02875 [Candidatus Saccharibacteria bacterium]|jgi:uncharacterized membrane protein YidH (DUF202 family)|nr:MAG: hypothetical protein IPO96_02875 [Candidatus Saccharibacteria bacterium]